MTLLVTGAMGHVGYEIVRKAAQRGMQVIGVYRDDLPEAEAKAAGSGVKWLQCDLADAAPVLTSRKRRHDLVRATSSRFAVAPTLLSTASKGAGRA